jgi:4-nitrophenyl phosphatase
MSELTSRESDRGHHSVETKLNEATDASEQILLERYRRAKAFIIDMDGVLYRGGDALPGVNDFFNALELRERKIILATNNSTASPADYVAKMAKMGISVTADQVLTSSTVTRAYLQMHLPAGATIYVVGMPALSEQVFDGTSFAPADASSEKVDAVVAGLDFTFTYEKLKIANRALRAGAAFIATNTDATLPAEDGVLPGSGSIMAAIATASGKQPVVMGKPETVMVEQALKVCGVSADEAVMVGDRLDTDILAGNRANVLSALVLTGVSTREELATSPILPDLVFSDLPAMLETLVGNG